MTEAAYHFTDIAYLNDGNVRQRSAFRVLNDLEIMTALSSFDPLLVGTVPIEIDLPTSDLDIVCEFQDAAQFAERLVQEYRKYEDFVIKTQTVDQIERVVCNFTYEDWIFEIFGQPVPTLRQNGYKHMIIEYRILNILGNKAKEYIIDLKSGGLKTEPAFGKMLNLQGDPYQALLEMCEWDEERLRNYLKRIRSAY
ncbi:HIT family protein [Saccharibacillus sp. O23]|uniref:DUF4269 domain-containing protein n=1 Tax=Saccharibacillus sp. O23 TaxID=2009338 RepID=UPI000B4E2BDB|nr:DUF4269 domain-containing protein [Saccharibacillus sp. O23]OWR32312.1 HIT family protein [Saccharibacillus sp. O23]